MKKSKKILIWFLAFITLLILLPFFISMETYIKEAEKLAGEKLGVPVSIASGRLMLLPSPRVVVNNISVGKHDELKVDNLIVIPSLGSLFSATKVIDVEIGRPQVKQSALELVSSLAGKQSDAGADSAMVSVRHVSVDELQLDWPNIKLPVFNVEVNLADGNALNSAYIETVDVEVNANITPDAKGHLIMLKAKGWKLPLATPVLIDRADIEMHLKGSRLDVPKLAVGLYGGEINGNLALSWAKNWQMDGKLKAADISVKEPSSLVSKSVYLSGNLAGDVRFSAQAQTAGKLMEHLQASFKFNVNNGVLHGLDLVKVASLLVKQGENGGETHFDEFSGLLNVTGKQYHLKDIKLSSGLLAASGQVKVKPDKKLDGAVEVELKRSVSLVAIPLDVSGTVSDPVVLPSKAALAGAVAGTAILGPGVGTSLGVKAGGAVDKIKGLFQSD